MVFLNDKDSIVLLKGFRLRVNRTLFMAFGQGS